MASFDNHKKREAVSVRLLKTRFGDMIIFTSRVIKLLTLRELFIPTLSTNVLYQG